MISEAGQQVINQLWSNELRSPRRMTHKDAAHHSTRQMLFTRGIIEYDHPSTDHIQLTPYGMSIAAHGVLPPGDPDPVLYDQEQE